MCGILLNTIFSVNRVTLYSKQCTYVRTYVCGILLNTIFSVNRVPLYSKQCTYVRTCVAYCSILYLVLTGSHCTQNNAHTYVRVWHIAQYGEWHFKVGMIKDTLYYTTSYIVWSVCGMILSNLFTTTPLVPLKCAVITKLLL